MILPQWPFRQKLQLTRAIAQWPAYSSSDSLFIYRMSFCAPEIGHRRARRRAF
jgi:hypothetical protein